MEVEGFDEIKEEERKSPFKYIIAIFFLLLVVLMIVPYYGIKNDPNPCNQLNQILSLNLRNQQQKNLLTSSSNTIIYKNRILLYFP